MLLDALKQAGLTTPEAEAYLACLRLGTQGLAFIARETGLPPSDTRQALRALEHRGLVTRYTAGRREFFTAEPPAALRTILERGRGRPDKGLSALGAMIPELERFARPGHTRPDIAVYEGKQALIAAYEDTLTAATEIVAVASVDDIESTLKDYIPQYYRRRKAAGIPIRAIFPDTPASRKRQAKDAQELRESRLLPAGLMQMSIETNVYDDKVVFFALKEEMAVLIRSPLIADAMRATFELQWKMAAMLKP